MQVLMRRSKLVVSFVLEQQIMWYRNIASKFCHLQLRLTLAVLDFLSNPLPIGFTTLAYVVLLCQLASLWLIEVFPGIVQIFGDLAPGHGWSDGTVNSFILNRQIIIADGSGGDHDQAALIRKLIIVNSVVLTWTLV